MGEYSVDRGSGEGDLESALAEAAFMMGLERNSDLVRISSYAPLLSNVNDNAWPVNMIHFDNYRVAPRTSYYVQKLFSENRPDEVVKTVIDPSPAPGAGNIYAIGGWDGEREQIVLKAVNRAGISTPITIDLRSLPAAAGHVAITVLSNPDPTAENSVDDLTFVVPVTSGASAHSDTFTYKLAANSLTIFRFDTEKISSALR